MVDDPEQTAELTNAFRPRWRPRVFVLLVNLAIALLLLGIPYVRGRHLANLERQNFVAFTRCLFGGKPVATPGLSFPRGESDHFAANVLVGASDWPLSCRPPLAKLAPPDEFFLWPSLKRAGADLRAAVALLDRELQLLAISRKQMPSVVPKRPLDALQRLQAASVLFVRAADADGDIDNEAFALKPEVAGLVIPSRLPLLGRDGSTLEVWSRGGKLEAFALDARGVSFLSLSKGKLDHDRVRRTGFLRGVVSGSSTPYLVWAMPDSRCAQSEDRCAGRPTGMAPLVKGADALKEPKWKLFGHPAGRLDRVFEVSDLGEVDLLALASAQGGVTLLRFRLPSPDTGTPAEAKAVALEAIEEWPTPVTAGPSSATLIAGEPRAVGVASDTTQGVEVSVTWAVAGAKPLHLEGAAGSGPWVVACSTAQGRWLAYGSSGEMHIASIIDPASGAKPLIKRAVSLKNPLDSTDPSRDQVRLICEGSRAELLYTTSDRALMQTTCTGETCGPATGVAVEAAQFAAVLSGDATVLAYYSGAQEPAIKVMRLDALGAPLGAPIIPAACWQPRAGMCGSPNLTSDGPRIVLFARDGRDLLALETTDQARSFKSLSGMPANSALEPDARSLLQRYRERKHLK